MQLSHERRRVGFGSEGGQRQGRCRKDPSLLLDLPDQQLGPS